MKPVKKKESGPEWWACYAFMFWFGLVCYDWYTTSDLYQQILPWTILFESGESWLTLSMCVLWFGLVQASFVGAMAIADLVKTTLGPKGMVKSLLHSLLYVVVINDFIFYS